MARAIELWEGLSHSALLRLIVIVLNVVAAKTNLRENNIEYEFKTMSLLVSIQFLPRHCVVGPFPLCIC